MYKISFKGEYKAVKVEDRVTTVSIIGETQFPPYFWSNVPNKVFDWPVCNENWIVSYNYIKFQGKAVRHPDDEDDPVLAERIAEARAKIKLYKFMYNLLKETYASLCKRAFGVDDFYPSHVKKDSIYGAMEKYQKLWITESHHLGVLLQ